MISSLPAGLHEIEEPQSLIAIIGERGDQGNQLIVIATTDELEYIEQNMAELLNYSAIAVLIALLAAAGISFYLIQRIVSPLKKFTRQITRYEPGHENIDFSQFERRDEIGLMAQAFDKMQNRIARFIDREKRFTADVSHELRTPLTVLSHSIEMIGTQTKCSPAQKPLLDRMERSTLRMNTLVGTFLTLARKSKPKTQHQTQLLNTFLEEALDYQSTAYPRNPIKIEKAFPAELELKGESALVAILIRNIVNNAALHAPGNSLTVRHENGNLYFENALVDCSTQSAGESTGIGLSIADRVASRLGYKMSSGFEDGVFRVRVELATNNSNR